MDECRMNILSVLCEQACRDLQEGWAVQRSKAWHGGSLKSLLDLHGILRS